MNDFNGLAIRLRAKAAIYQGNPVGELLTEAAYAISVQAGRIADLEQHLNQRDAALERMDKMLNDDGRQPL